jgi:hypothetical protein
MKKSKLYISLLALSVISLSSCKNELEVLAPGEESVSVYGVLNPNQSVQNIRINKVYLTEGDALTAGQDASQINYGPGELKVTLQRFMTGNTTPTLTTVGNTTKKEIILTETVVTTAGGDFNVNQRIWQTTDKLFNSGNYKLIIKNLNTGKEFSSQTMMIDSVKSSSSMPFIWVQNVTSPPNAYPTHCNGYVIDIPVGTGTRRSAYVDYSNTSFAPNIKFKSVANGTLYKVIMRFHYIDSLAGGIGVRNYVDFNFTTQKPPSKTGGEDMSVSFPAIEFYKNLAIEIPKKSTGTVLFRTSHYIEYIITVGNDDLNTFLEINQPSNSIAQDKPNYSNINGGVGIFACSSRSTISKDLLDDFIDEISDNSITQPLLFKKNYSFICP